LLNIINWAINCPLIKCVGAKGIDVYFLEDLARYSSLGLDKSSGRLLKALIIIYEWYQVAFSKTAAALPPNPAAVSNILLIVWGAFGVIKFG